MPADILTVADAIVTDLTARVASVGDVTVERVYELTHDLGTFNGKRVEVYPLRYRSDEVIDRISASYDFRYSIVVMERHRVKGTVPKAWIDTRVEFVEEKIFNTFDPTARINRNEFYMVVGADQYYVTEVDVTTVYDFDFLRQQSVFWSEVEVVFRKDDGDLT